MTTDNVVQLPDALERLSTRIKSNLARADKLDADRIEALVAVAIDVAQARDTYRDDISFGEWWDAQKFKLEERLLNHNERAALIAMGKEPNVMREVLSATDHRSIRLLYEESKDRFSSAAKPPRRKVVNRKTPLKPQQDKIRDEVERIVRAGEPLSRKDIAAKYGVGQLTVHLVAERIKGMMEAESRARTAGAEPTIDPKTLSMTAQQRLDAVMKHERKRLELENKIWLDKQIDFHIKRLKTEHLPRWEEDARKARISRERYQKLINDHKPPLSKAEYQLILLTAHEDNSASQETRKRAAIILNNKKFILTGDR